MDFELSGNKYSPSGLQLSLSAAGIALVLHVIYSLYLHPLASIPGPLFARLSYAWLYTVSLGGRRCLEVHELHKKYGPIIRVAPNIVSFIDASVWSTVYGRFPKSNFYHGSKMMDGTQDHTFTTIDYEEHRPIRKITGPTYSQANVNEFVPELRQNIERLLDCIDRDGQKGREAVDTMWYLKLLACDAVGLVGFGQYWGSIEHGKSDAVTWTDGKMVAVILRSANYDWVVRNIIKRIPSVHLRTSFQHEKNFEDYAESLLEPARRQLKENLEIVKKEKQTLMTRLLTTPLSTTGKPVDDKYITCELVAHVSAGTDTSSITSSYILYALAKHPKCMARVQAELNEAFGSERTIDLATCKALPYFEAVMQEGLRLYTSAPSHLERVVPANSKELFICGHHIPPGTVIATQAYSVHRDPRIYAEPDRFWPERWLEKEVEIDSETRLEMQRRMMPFGLGTRMCVGMLLAGANMRMSTAALLHQYDVIVDEKTSDESMYPSGNFIMAPQSHHCYLVFHPRESVDAVRAQS